MSAESFLDRYSLPRIARLIAPKAFHDDQQKQQSQSNSMLGKSKKPSTANHYLHQHPINSNQQQLTAATNNSGTNDTNSSDDIKADNNNNGELFLLYRHLKKYKVYHAVNAKSGTNRKKGIKIPQDFTGECCWICASLSLATHDHNVRNVTLISPLRHLKFNCSLRPLLSFAITLTSAKAVAKKSAFVLACHLTKVHSLPRNLIEIVNKFISIQPRMRTFIQRSPFHLRMANSKHNNNH